MTSSLSGAMTDEEEDQEINVDSGHEDGEDVECEDADEDSCGGDSPTQSLPFSISRLLGDTVSARSVTGDNAAAAAVAAAETITSLYSHPSVMHLKSVPSQGLLYSPGAGVIRVPAHRPPPPGAAGPPGLHGPPLASPFPWLAAAIDPTLMHRSAAAAAFASQVVKERLSGQ